MAPAYPVHLFKAKSLPKSQEEPHPGSCSSPHNPPYVLRWNTETRTATERLETGSLDHGFSVGDRIISEDFARLSFHIDDAYLSYLTISIQDPKQARSDPKWPACIRVSGEACRMIHLRQIDKSLYEQITPDPNPQAEEQFLLISLDCRPGHLSSERLFVEECDPNLEDVKQAFANTTRFCIVLRVRSPSAFRDHLSRLMARFSSDEKTDPVNTWLRRLSEGPKMRPFQLMPEAQMPRQRLHATNPPTFSSPYRSAFFSWHDYAATMGFGAKIEWDLTEKDKSVAFRSPLVFIELQKGGSRNHCAIFKVPKSQDENFTPGDKASAYLPSDTSNRPMEDSSCSASASFSPNDDKLEFARPPCRRTWDLGIVAPMFSAPKGVVFARLERRWDKKKARFTDENQYQYPVITQGDIPPDAGIVWLLKQAKTFAMITPDIRHSSFCYVFEALKELHRYPPKASMRQATREVLIAKSFEAIPKYDIYRPIEDISHASEDNLELNESQKGAIRLARAAPAGFVICHGGPGTGKTHFVVQAVKPFLLDWTKRHRILLTAAGNRGADSIAKALSRELQQLVKDGKTYEHDYVLRLHSIKTEREIALSEAETSRQRILKDRLSKKIESKTKPNLQPQGLAQASAIFDHCQAFSKFRFEGINDERVRLVNLSAGRKMLQIAGVEDGGSLEDSLKFAGFYDLYHKYRKGEDFSDEMRRELDEQTDELLAYAIQNATGICATIGGAADSFVTKNYDSAELVVIDEAARVPEYLMWPLLASYPNAIGKVLVGDPDQLRPVVEEDLQKNKKNENVKNPFRAQLEISLQERLQAAGFKCTFFDEQYRAVPEIAEIYSKACYASRLTSHPSTDVQHRPLAQAILEHNIKQYGIHKNVLFYDIPNAMERRLNRKPKVCLEYATVVVKILEDLLKTGFGSEGLPCTIAVLTPYKAQEKILRIAMSKMACAANVSLETVDRVQGNEYDVCIVDPVSVDRPGFLTKNRLNVMFSRARHGLYVVGNYTAWSSMWRSDSLMLRKFATELAKHKKKWDPKVSLCSDFCKPELIEVDESSDDSD